MFEISLAEWSLHRALFAGELDNLDFPAFARREVIASFDRETGELETRAPVSAATIRQLLSHSSGLAYGFASNIVATLSDGPGGPADQSAPLLYDPGTAWSYSQGISIVGAVVERIEGAGLDTIMQERLFDPLGMTETRFIVRAADVPRVATVHRVNPDGGITESANA